MQLYPIKSQTEDSSTVTETYVCQLDPSIALSENQELPRSITSTTPSTTTPIFFLLLYEGKEWLWKLWNKTQDSGRWSGIIYFSSSWKKRLKRERKILQFNNWLHTLSQWERFGLQDDGLSNLGDEPLSQDKFYISKECLSKACETWLEGF